MNGGICLGGYKVCFWRRVIFKAALVGRAIFWPGIFILGVGPGGEISKIEGEFDWQSAAYALWESFFCQGVCLGLVVLFRERFNSGGRFGWFMADNDFSVYMFAWQPLVKFVVAAAVAVPLCFITSSLVFRRIPQLEKVL